MLPSDPGILAEATSTFIKTLYIVFFLILYYTFKTYDERKSNEQRAKCNKKKAQPRLRYFAVGVRILL